MKKKLAVVTIEKDAKDEYVSQLQRLFSDCLEVTGYSVREKIEGTISADLVLISASTATSIVKPYLPQGVETVYIDVMFVREKIEQLYKLPPETSAMLVDYTYSTAVDIISVLHEIGIKHINFTPVYLGMKEKDIPDIDLAVTASLQSYIPSGAKEILDIGWRQIGVSTLINIATKLQFLDPQLEEKLIAYASNLVPSSKGLTSILQASSQIKNQMEVVLEIIDEGVVVIDTQDIIVHCNEKLCNILSLSVQNLKNKKIKELNLNTPSHEKIFMTGLVENLLVEIDKTAKKFVVTKREIEFQGKKFGSVIFIKDVTQIQNLESTLRGQLTRRGHVAKYQFEEIIGQSPVMVKCIEKAKKISSKDATVLISGETGTGKELFAQSIHNYSARKNMPFIAINCAALPAHLLESELFGYEPGAFTGALKGGKRGLFELAHNGTLFLDEVGDIPLEVQVKLLRVLEEREMMRIGGTNIIPIDVRIIAATNREFQELINNGKVRKDLYYRLNVLSLYLPPLRDRKPDIPFLVEQILADIGCSEKILDQELTEILKGFPWEGNIRELKNCIEYMGYMGGAVLSIEDLPESMDVTISDQSEKIQFKELKYQECQIGKSILEILKFRNAGRRLIHELLTNQGFETSEYEIRKILGYLQEKKLIVFGKGKKGAQLTGKGKALFF